MSFHKKSPWHKSASKIAPPDREWWIKHQRKRAAKVGGAWSALAHAKRSGDMQRIIEAAKQCTLLCSSEQRLERLIRAVADQPPKVFWPVWLGDWSNIDFTAEYHHLLPWLFKSKGSALPYLSLEAKGRYDELPEVVTVYRGCDKRLIRGVSWSTDGAVAGYFATGGRYGRPREPVIVTGIVKKRSRNYFYCCEGSYETEIVCSPTITKVERYTGPWPGDSDYNTPWAARAA